MLKTANNQEEQIRLIKTIGNFADPVFLPDLKTLFAIKSTPKPVRIQAIYAIRKFAQMPEIKDQVGLIFRFLVQLCQNSNATYMECSTTGCPNPVANLHGCG